MATRISSVTLTTRNGTDGAVMPKSPNFQLGFAVTVAVRSLPSRLATTSNVTSLVFPRMVMLPVSVNVNVPVVARGSESPLTLVGTNSALGNCRTCKVSCLMKLSRLRSSLESVVRSKLIFEPDSNVPSPFSSNDPVAPVAVSTASDGRLTPTSCSRTRTVALDLSVTVHAPADAAVVAAGVALAVAVGVEVGAAGDADPPQAAGTTPAKAKFENARASTRLVTRGWPPGRGGSPRRRGRNWKPPKS